MKAVLVTAFCLLGYSISKAEDSKPAEAKKPQICWESVELYNDSDFKEKMAEDSDMMKSYKKKLSKYQKRVKDEAKQTFEDEGVELVECPDHKTDSDLKKVAKEDKPMHMKVSLAYDGVLVITVYAKVEVFRGDEKVVEFKKDKSAFILDVCTRAKYQAAIREFAKEVIKELGKKMKDVKPVEEGK